MRALIVMLALCGCLAAEPIGVTGFASGGYSPGEHGGCDYISAWSTDPSQPLSIYLAHGPPGCGAQIFVPIPTTGMMGAWPTEEWGADMHASIGEISSTRFTFGMGNGGGWLRLYDEAWQPIASADLRVWLTVTTLYQNSIGEVWMQLEIRDHQLPEPSYAALVLAAVGIICRRSSKPAPKPSHRL